MPVFDNSNTFALQILVSAVAYMPITSWLDINNNISFDLKSFINI